MKWCVSNLEHTITGMIQETGAIKGAEMVVATHVKPLHEVFCVRITAETRTRSFIKAIAHSSHVYAATINYVDVIFLFSSLMFFAEFFWSWLNRWQH